MADVTRGPRRRIDEADRGQLILITGLVIAIAIVILVLLLNTVIYTENLATRGLDGDGSDAIQFQDTAIDGSGQIVDGENFEEYDDYSDVKGNVTDGIADLDSRLSNRTAPYSAVSDINTSSIDHTEGRLVRQTNETREFKGGDLLENPDWQMAQEIENTREFVLTVDQSSLNTTDAGNASDDAFYVRVEENGGGSEWHLYVFENDGDPGDVSIAVKNGSESDPTLLSSCSVSGGEATIDLTRGSVNGTDCNGIQWASGVDPKHDIYYRNGDEARGTYDVILDTSGVGETIDDALYSLSDSDNPYQVKAVYSVEFSILYETPEITYGSKVRVAPGEPS